MNVEILAKSPEWLNVCWVATRTCKSAKTPMELKAEADKTAADDKVRLMKAIFKAGHTSIFEHATISFQISEVSRALLAQFTRHRVGWSYSVQSQRYVSMSGAGFVRPVTLDIERDPLLLGPGIVGFEDKPEWGADEIYSRALACASNSYNLLLACGVPKEDARMVMPMGIYCNMVASCNLRSFLDAYHKRVEVKGAQWEIKAMFERMKDLIVEQEPWVENLLND